MMMLSLIILAASMLIIIKSWLTAPQWSDIVLGADYWLIAFAGFLLISTTQYHWDVDVLITFVLLAAPLGSLGLLFLGEKNDR